MIQIVKSVCQRAYVLLSGRVRSQQCGVKKYFPYTLQLSSLPKVSTAFVDSHFAFPEIMPGNGSSLISQSVFLKPWFGSWL